uniref:C2H2-type domain-containing protein n=1 Tax=Timema poppense TaxID=170557 RepID=A0A7R9H9Z2_TIMPO|nr:unnamed protein product [Timema poppensis]
MNRENYKCHDLSKPYTKNFNNIYQFLNKSEQRPYKCDICSKYFKHKSIFKTHLVSHGEHRLTNVVFVARYNEVRRKEGWVYK